MDRLRLSPWIVRVVWAALPFAAGPAFAAALDRHSAAVRTTASVALWAVWAVVLCATLVLHPISLTVVRVVGAAGVAGAAWTVTQPGVGGVSFVALVVTVIAMAVVFLPETGLVFVNGSAYPNERRFPLRPPGPLLFGPLPLAWVATVGLPVAAVLLLAARQWLAGAAAGVLAIATVGVFGRALHGLSRRWLVFVPAGVVLHDPIALADPVLFRRQSVHELRIAPADTAALDLTQRAPGLALQLDLVEAATLVLTKPGQRIGPTEVTTSLLCTPTRPGRVLAEARERRLAPPATR